MDPRSRYLSNVRVERVIASVRVLLASSSLLATWLDPTDPAHVTLTYSLYAAYVTYAVVLAAVMWRRESTGRLPIAAHVTDVAIACAFQYFTFGTSSPFFLYFVFSLFSAALRWGWKQTIWTAAVELTAFVAMSVSLGFAMGWAAFQLNRFIIRFVYLNVIAGLLAYLGQHEARLREEIRRLARWPAVASEAPEVAVPKMIEHAAGIVSAQRATVAWSSDDEPWVYVASWPASDPVIVRHAPTDFEPLVPEPLTDAAFISSDPVGATIHMTVSRSGSSSRFAASPAHQKLLPLLNGVGLASAPFRAERLSGRVFFTDLAEAGLTLLSLVEVVAREIGASLDQLDSSERSRQLAIIDDRMQVARDLHDGVLQSLTGIRFELQGMATAEQDAHAPLPVADRVLALERALALEQRELRRFIEGLKPGSAAAATGSFAANLEELGRRLSDEWTTPVNIRISPADLRVTVALQQAASLMINEAIVNALKHGQPSRVSVDVRSQLGGLNLLVADDGRGFPFRGRFDHAALAAANLGPKSLRDRVEGLHGSLTIDSSASGSRIEIDVPAAGVLHG